MSATAEWWAPALAAAGTAPAWLAYVGPPDQGQHQVALARLKTPVRLLDVAAAVLPLQRPVWAKAAVASVGGPVAAVTGDGRTWWGDEGHEPAPVQVSALGGDGRVLAGLLRHALLGASGLPPAPADTYVRRLAGDAGPAVVGMTWAQVVEEYIASATDTAHATVLALLDQRGDLALAGALLEADLP